MTSAQKIRVAVIGASGYTGADLVRLAYAHPNMQIVALTAKSHAGKPLESVFPHLSGLGLPDLVTNDEVNWANVDAAFCGLPHATSQNVIKALPEHVRIIDMSADFRLRNPKTYKQWYGNEHAALDLQATAVYGLTEHYRKDIAKARLVACPGCYPTAVLMLLVPLVAAGLIDASDLVIDAKSGVSGAGRALKQNTLFCESGEGMGPYAIGKHRHSPEIEQELSLAAGREVTVSFTPHLVPMSRGEFITAYARLTAGNTAADCQAVLVERYNEEPFVNMAPDGVMPATQFVRGSNRVMMGVVPDRIEGRVVLLSTLDNLVKGSAGQAMQNFNLMFGLPETTGLEQVTLFP